jgi:uncharacterized Zn-binding protein involved in type VI secretion
MRQPAAKQGDRILASDTHIVLVPFGTSLVPVPMPHPFNGRITSGLSANVNIMGKPAATVGSAASNSSKHAPTSPGTSFQKPPSNTGTILVGSRSVFINGKPAARQSDVAMTCNDPVDVPVGKVVVGSGTVFFA